MNISKMKRKNKKAIVWHELGLWIIALIALAIILVSLFMGKEKLLTIIEKLRSAIRFR